MAGWRRKLNGSEENNQPQLGICSGNNGVARRQRSGMRSWHINRKKIGGTSENVNQKWHESVISWQSANESVNTIMAIMSNNVWRKA